MLSSYKEIEPIIYAQMNKSIEKGLSHAYLFNLNGNVYASDMIMSFVKTIICKNHQTKEEYEACTTCKRIDEDNYLEIKKIYPDGTQIKKEQLEELQKSFSTKSIESSKRIYIIYEAEKLNNSAANSLLKFLEEPEEGIIAILLTNNINQIMETILSRCQLLTFSKNKVEDYIKYNKISEYITLHKLSFAVWKENNITDEIDLRREFIDNVVLFVKNYETDGVKLIMSINKVFHNNFKTNDEIKKFFECLILFYRDLIGYKLNGQVMYYDDYIDEIKKISTKNTLEKLVNKLNVIIDSEKYIRSNANIALLIDSMIIDMED